MPCGGEQNHSIRPWGPDANLCHLRRRIIQERDAPLLMGPGRDYAPNHGTRRDRVSRFAIRSWVLSPSPSFRAREESAAFHHKVEVEAWEQPCIGPDTSRLHEQVTQAPVSPTLCTSASLSARIYDCVLVFYCCTATL